MEFPHGRKKMGQQIKVKITIIASLFLVGLASATAYTVESHPETPIENRFIVGPAKLEAEIKAGNLRVLTVNLENRTGKEKSFRLSFEDFLGSSNTENTVTLLGDKKSQFSLKDYLFVPEREVKLKHGDQVKIPITVTIPAVESPGGKFGALIISAESANKLIGQKSNTQAAVIGRIATLFFIKVPGKVKEEAKLVSFFIKNNRKIFLSGKIELRITMENSGNVNLNPYGGITVKNIFGEAINKIPIEPWFVLPDSVRTRDVEINLPSAIGLYSATLEINRGYSDIVDVREVKFFILPKWLIVLVLLLVGSLIVVKNTKRN